MDTIDIHHFKLIRAPCLFGWWLQLLAILYPLWLKPLFPNDVRILKPKVGLGLNQIEIDLRKVFLEKYNFLWTK